MHLVNLAVSNFYFDVFPPFYFLKWNRYFSACENLSNSSCHFEKYKSVFFQILHQSLVPSNITLLYFLAQKLYTFVKRSLIKCKFLRNLSAQVKSRQIVVSILKRQVNSSSNFALFFIVIVHNSSVIFKLIYFLLWIKRSHQSPNVETFECSSKNLANSSCHFPNHQSVFLQFLHQSSVSWKISPLCYFSSNIINFVQKEPIKV